MARRRAGPMNKLHVIPGAFLLLSWCACEAAAQSDPLYVPTAKMRSATPPACSQIPREDADPRLCVLASGEENEGVETEIAALTKIELKISAGTPLRIAIDQRTRILREGEAVRGRVVQTVYAFDHPVIPAGTVASGRVTKIGPVSGAK